MKGFSLGLFSKVAMELKNGSGTAIRRHGTDELSEMPAVARQ